MSVSFEPKKIQTSIAVNVWQYNLLEDFIQYILPIPKGHGHTHIELRISVDTVSVRNDLHINSNPQTVLNTQRMQKPLCTTYLYFL